MTDQEKNYILIGAGVIIVYLLFTRKPAMAGDQVQPGIYVEQEQVPPGIIRIDIDIEKASQQIWEKIKDLLNI